MPDEKKWLQKGQTQMKMKQLRHEKKIYRELERMRKSRTFESSTDRTGQEPDDFLNMSAAQRLRMIHAEKCPYRKQKERHRMQRQTSYNFRQRWRVISCRSRRLKTGPFIRTMGGM